MSKKSLLLSLLAVTLASALGLGGCLQDSGRRPVDDNCGNGEIDPGEQCDDGNRVDHDGCDARCRLEGFCGNGVVELGEECDDGNFEPMDGCRSDCEVELGCGNGLLELGEECDDDNLTDGDGCTATCVDEIPGFICGDKIHEVGEGCDDGNNEAGDGCTPDCQREDGCGNGIVDGVELCDDGNNVTGDGCSGDCRVEFICGNDVCEENNYETCELCPHDCCVDCGNLVLDQGEECDDGNNDPGDGCSRGCLDEDSQSTCGNNIWEIGEECEDGNTEVLDGCSDTCEIEFVCGDQVCESARGETCALCQPDCCPNCGNGVRQVTEGEECDIADLGGRSCTDFCYDPGTLGCSSSCQFDFSTCGGSGPSCGDGVAECSEQCDLNDFKGQSCFSLGFETGSVACNANCTLDLADCQGFRWYLFEDFDAVGAPAGWAFSGDWDFGEPTDPDGPATAFSGLQVAGTNVAGDYSNNRTFDGNRLVTPTIDLTAAVDPRLVFFMFVRTENCCDGANVWISTDDGVNFTQLDNPSVPYSDVLVAQDVWQSSTAFAFWQQVIFDLSAFAGQSQVKLAFSMRTDGSVIYPGFYVDDIVVTESNQVPIAITTTSVPGGVVDNAYTSPPLNAVGGTGAFVWSIQPGGTNDSWLDIDPGTGTMDGTPTIGNAGNVSVIVRAADTTDASNFDERQFDFFIAQPIVPPYAESFDSGPNGWELTGEWQHGVPTVGPPGCFAGSCLGTVLAGNYSNSQDWADNAIISPPIDLTAAVTPMLQFKSWLHAECCCDGGHVEVSTDGINFSIHNAVTPAYNGSAGGQSVWYCTTWNTAWFDFTADLSAYAGQVIWIRLPFRTDGSVTYPGWYIDELSISN